MAYWTIQKKRLVNWKWQKLSTIKLRKMAGKKMNRVSVNFETNSEELMSMQLESPKDSGVGRKNI